MATNYTDRVNIRKETLDTFVNRINAKMRTTGAKTLEEAIDLMDTLSHPEGTLEITENGTVDVKDYANANVNVDNIADLSNGTLTEYTSDKLTNVKSYLFYNTSNLTIKIPNCETIEKNAFEGCTNSTLYISNALKNVANNGFYNNTNMIVYYDGTINTYLAINYANYGTVEHKGTLYVKNANNEYILKPTEIVSNYITSVGAYNQYGAKITKFDAPNCESVGMYAFFSNKSLTEVNIPKCTSLGSYAFNFCEALTTVHIDSVSAITSQCFLRCTALTDIYLGYDGVVTIQSTSFTSAINGTCQVHVKAEYATSYQTATNWSALIAGGHYVIVGDYVD